MFHSDIRSLNHCTMESTTENEWGSISEEVRIKVISEALFTGKTLNRFKQLESRLMQMVKTDSPQNAQNPRRIQVKTLNG